MGLTAASYEHPVTLLFARPLPAALAAWQERGRPLVTVALARNGPKGHERYKAHSFLNNLLARRELGEGDAEGLMRTTDGRVVEGIVSNVFLVRGNELVTLALSAGILPGVTRRFVLALALQVGLVPVERDVWPEELVEADEVFVTNAVQELVPICAIAGRPVRACPGPCTRRLLSSTTSWPDKACGRWRTFCNPSDGRKRGTSHDAATADLVVCRAPHRGARQNPGLWRADVGDGDP